MKPFTVAELPALFNEWMRQFTENPHTFKAEFQIASLFIAEKSAGHTPSYGEGCTSVLLRIRKELAAPAASLAAELVVAAPKKKRRKSRKAKR